MRFTRLAMLCALFALPSAALAARVEIALRVPLEPIREALAEELAASSDATGALYREGRCRYLKLAAPTLTARDGRLELVAPGAAALGAQLAGVCRNALFWRGTVHLTLAPQLDAGRLRVRVVDSRLSDDGGPPSALPLAWQLAKGYVHPRLEKFGYDVEALRHSLLSIVRAAAPPESRDAMEHAISRAQPLVPRVEEAAILLPIALDIPDAWLVARSSTATASVPLTAAELEALDRALQPWDAFLVYAIKQLARDSGDSVLRQRLFTLLLESRYRLSAILAGEPQDPGDPLRALFIDAWNELRSIIADAERSGVLDHQLLRYALFVEGGEALVALERAAPGLDLRLSADALRQLARTLRPSATEDPVAYVWTVDPELQRLFAIDEIAATHPLPPASPPLAPRRSWLELFIRSAHASSGRKLDAWVPTSEEIDTYQEQIDELLRRIATIELQKKQLGAAYQRIYRSLLPATALIESCWRQYTVRAGKATFVRSPAGSVGIMQINERVWRGFYDIQRLRWDTAYNARAGAQILLRYMRDYAIPYAERSGDAADIPRAAYAVYNAGPRAVGRFDKTRPHPREERVDTRLWKLYRGMAAGGRADLRTCSVSVAAAGG